MLAQDSERRRELWAQTAEAYVDAASTKFGDPEFFFDAATAYLEAGELYEALENLEQYSASREGGQSEHRYWQKRILKARIHRLIGQPAKSLEIVDDAIFQINPSRTYPQKYELLLEKGRALEELGREPEALTAYHEVMFSQTYPQNRPYLDALYRKCVLLQAKYNRSHNAPNLSQENQREISAEAHEAWRELASKLKSTSADLRLGEAHYHVGLGWIVRGDYDRARRALDQLDFVCKYALNQDIDPADRKEWKALSERGAFAHADAYFLAGDYEEAVVQFQLAIENAPNSSLTALGFLQQGICFQRLGQPREARHTFEMGKRRVAELPLDTLKQLPTDQDQEFWIQLFDDKLKALDREAKK